MIGTRLAHYEITVHLGSGGMGEVYQAKDAKLGRSVAIKIIPEAFAHDVDRVARFEREARVLASLNHPHIAAIHGVEEAGGRNFLVMELVEGETLAERIARGAVPIDEALPIAMQVAEAVEAAHEKGVVHRDLKPANIKITPDGTVKVLDFGLAKIREGEGATVALSNSPTLMTPASSPGMILGTAAYMSPEQAKGKGAERTSDVWAFGCVLYEMLTGRPTFGGETVGELFAGILKGEPDWTRLPTETPENIRRLLRRCLHKDRKLRLQHLGDARIEIAEPQIANLVTSLRRRRETVAWAASLMFVSLVATVLAVWDFRPTLPSPEIRVEITTPPITNPFSLAISPDGQKVVFAANSEGGSLLWLRPLDSVSASPLIGTDAAFLPFWSPDSRSVGFFANGQLKRIDLDGGSVQILAGNVLPAGGGTWNRDGVILFSRSRGPIYRISAAGGEAVAITGPTGPQQGHESPRFLSGGRFLYYVAGSSEVRGVNVGQIDQSETRRLLDADSTPEYTHSGQLLFVRQGTLFAQDFDVANVALTGSAYPIAEDIASDPGSGRAALSVSDTGQIIYRTGAARTDARQFVWFDRSGKEMGRVGDPISTLSQPSLSRDGRFLTFGRTLNGNRDIWLLEATRGVVSRFTSDEAFDNFPIWSPDGDRILFQSYRTNSVGDLYHKSVAGTGNEEPLVETTENKMPSDWSSDGRFVLYKSSSVKTGWDIWAASVDGDRKPFAVVETNFEERDAQFSSDGKWIAYQSNETGRFEIYVQQFPQSGRKWGPFSTNGGAQVRWRADSNELFYIALDGRLMAVPIGLDSEKQVVESGAPSPLFATHVGGAVQSPGRQQYSVSPDGQRFLMATIANETNSSPITLILNWKPK